MKKIMKKCAVLATLFAFVLSLSACWVFKAPGGKEDDNSGGKKTASTTDPAKLIAMLKTAKTGDTFTMGVYEQDGKTKNGAEPIEWTVVYQGVGKVLVLSNTVLLRKQFIETEDRFASGTYYDSAIRTWLSGAFYDGAFSDKEKEMILSTDIEVARRDGDAVSAASVTEKVFLLSAKEYMRYVQNLETVPYGVPSEALKKEEPYMSPVEGVPGVKEAMTWWLRDTGADLGHAADIPGYSTKVNGYGDDVVDKRGVRPAMWVVWDKDYMTAYENGEAGPQIDAEIENKLKSAKAGDVIEFGAYDVDPWTSDGYETMCWQVLEVKDDRLLVFMTEPFTTMRFVDQSADPSADLSTVTWENSTVRSSLNSDALLNDMFTPRELYMVRRTPVSTPDAKDSWARDGGADTEDRLFLPSAEEIRKYYPNASDRISDDRTYWLRTPAFTEPYMEHVRYDGEIDTGYGPDYDGVRPMMWLKRGY